MKLTTKSLAPAVLAVFALGATSAQAGSSTDAPATPDWRDYRSAVSRSIAIKVDRSIETNTEDDHSVRIDKDIDDHSVRIDKDIDDHSVRVRKDIRTRTETQNTGQDVESTKYNKAIDKQIAGNKGAIGDRTQKASQGSFVLNGPLFSAPTTTYTHTSPGDGSRAFSFESRKLKQSNYTEIRGHNFGAVSSLNVANQGDGELQLGDKIQGNIMNSTLGNNQSLSDSGDQLLSQRNDQEKESKTTAIAQDTTTATTSR
jgi:hypothetical protein